MSSHESRLRDVVFVVLCVLGLAACGGGGGGSSPPSGPVKSTLSYPERSAVNTRTANGHTTSLTANGTAATEITNGLCSGTITQTVGPLFAIAGDRGNNPP